MNKGKTKMSNGTSQVIKTGIIVFGVVVTLVTTVFLGGSRIGRTEQSLIEARRESRLLSERQQLIIQNSAATEKHNAEVIATIRSQQSYQKGIVDTKLENIQKSVDRILEYISTLELVKDGES